jgi:DNA repair protein RadA/Sms
LAVALAIASNHLTKPLPKQTLVIGELGLSGEVRGVNLLELRIKEAARLGFKEMLVPAQGTLKSDFPGIKVYRIKTLAEAVEWLKDH